MRRPFTLDRDTFIEVINKEIQLFNKQFSYAGREMYMIEQSVDVAAVSRAIDDFDYLVHSYDPSSDELLVQYLRIRELLVGLRITLYAEMFLVDSVWE